MNTISRTSKEARDLARQPVGRTWVNADAWRFGPRWVRVGRYGAEGRGVYAVLELPNWLHYNFGSDTLSALILARTVTEMQDLGREPWVKGTRGVRHYIGRYQFDGTVYYLRDDDLGSDRAMPAGAVPIDQILSLPNLVLVSGFGHHSNDERPTEEDAND